MQTVLKNARQRFLAVIVLSLCTVVALILGAVQFANLTALRSPVHSSDLHQQLADDPAVAEYVETQKKYEAHFIELANNIREEDSRRLSQVVGIVAISSIVLGVVGAFFAVKVFMKPVEEAYTSQERFLQDAAHELRNPLAALTVALQQHKTGSPSDRLIETFRRQTRRLVNITEDLLFLERKQQADPEKQDISELLSDVVEELSPLATKKHVSLSLGRNDTIKKSIVSSDYLRLTRNIIENAIKYSPSGSKVNISQTKSKGTIILTVSDKGIGIPKDQIAMIGERFFRAQNVGEIDGTGLGMAIVKKIIKTYGGTILIDSTPRKGTTIRVKIPT